MMKKIPQVINPVTLSLWQVSIKVALKQNEFSCDIPFIAM
jgi:hypothetical protein